MRYQAKRNIPEAEQLKAIAQGLPSFYLLLQRHLDDLNTSGDFRLYITITRSKRMTASNPAKSLTDYKASVGKAWAVASHLISAFKLSNCAPADQAAIVMEVVRFVARSLVSTHEVHQSQATAVCLASIGPQYDRPSWFAGKLAEAIRQQIGDNLAHEVGSYLSQTVAN